MEVRITWSTVRGLQGVAGREADVLRHQLSRHLRLKIFEHPQLRSIIQTKLLIELRVIHRVTCLSQEEILILHGVVSGSLLTWQVFSDDSPVVGIGNCVPDPSDTYR